MHIYKLLLVLILLYSCGGGSSTSGIENNTQINQSSNSTEVCTNTQIANLKRCDLVHDNIDRFYYLYKPSNLDTNSSVAVLFALHGYGSSAMTHFNYTNYEPIANENNFIVDTFAAADNIHQSLIHPPFSNFVHFILMI